MMSAVNRAYSCPPGTDATADRTCPPALRSIARIAEVTSGDDMGRTLRHPPPPRPGSLALVKRRSIIALVIAPAAAATVALASGCGSSSAGGGRALLTPAADRPAAVPVSVPRLDGPGDITVGRPGARPTVVNLWASWCGPCKEEMPAVQRFATATPGVRVVGIAVDDAPDAAREFAREVGVEFPLGVDSDDGVADGYGFTGLPTTFVLDAQGRLASTWAGPVTESDLTALVDSLEEGS
ncbi:MAG: TlpA family protein disulfide reductase [Actinobacteria bacterium]|nr:TlpA family protein disulfide reductase [Actinomycetota bacterium]